MEPKRQIEAVLFAVGDKIEEAEIARITRLDHAVVKECLNSLRLLYQQGEAPFMVINEGTKWKLTVREEYMPIVQKIVPHTELNRPLMETLATIAWKAPVLQSDIVDMRGGKSYDHIGELLEMGFITKEKHGRSYMLALAQHFYEYFDLKGKEDIQDRFKEFKEVTQEDVILDELEKGGIQTYEDKLGSLEIVDEGEQVQKKLTSAEFAAEASGERIGKLEVYDESEQKSEPPPIMVYDEPVAAAEPPKSSQKQKKEKREEPEPDQPGDTPQPEEAQEEDEQKEPPPAETDAKLAKKLEEIEKIGEEITEELKHINE